MNKYEEHTDPIDAEGLPTAFARPANRWKRLLAYLIDILPITLLTFAVFYQFFGLDDTFRWYNANRGDPEARQQFLTQRNYVREATFFIWLAYCMVMESSVWQATLGKRIMGLKVVDEDGQRLSFSKAVSRSIYKLTSFYLLFLGFVWILIDKKRQGWHDKLAHTFVVEKEIVEE